MSTGLTTPDVTSISPYESSSIATDNTSTHYNIVTKAVSGACVVTLITGCFVICLRMKGSDNRIREIIETELRSSPIRPESSVEEIPSIPPRIPYYIYQEYLDGGNLRHFMLRNFEQSNKDHIESQSTSTDTIPTDGKNLHLIQFALEVACGMAYLAYNNYRHPGLCLKKVLLTNVMTCKLYDFWPDDLSGERLRTILDKPDPPTAWFPTETIFLRQYSGESDVWSYAVLLWELFSFGSTPYAGLSADELEREIRHGRTLPQPTNCPGGVYGIMLSSWDTVVTNRPPFSHLQEKIQTMLNALSQDICPLKGEEMSNEPKYFPLDGCVEENDYTESC
ncbi:hypothetical protein BSL78_09513 [Apostichopus japonicus]|uniref:Protein kinase domain-containing protein n=1 Tax=Stichopus japonicus TaxID=307972 RepID=A0A2G8L062_STIJA|nr:hypothetical protein BSL78_09513 [Apostichopus japonicus]